MDAISGDGAVKRGRRTAQLDPATRQVIIDKGAAARHYSPLDLPERARDYLVLLGLKQHLLTNGDAEAAFQALVREEIPDNRSAAQVQQARWAEAIAVELAHHAADRQLGDHAEPGAYTERVEQLLPGMRGKVATMKRADIERCCEMRPFQTRYSLLYGVKVTDHQIEALLEAFA